MVAMVEVVVVVQLKDLVLHRQFYKSFIDVSSIIIDIKLVIEMMINSVCMSVCCEINYLGVDNYASV